MEKYSKMADKVKTILFLTDKQQNIDGIQKI